MNKLRAVFASCLLAATSAAPVQAQNIPAAPSHRLEPAGGWTVDYAETECRLQRQFSHAGKPAAFSLALEPITTTAWMRIALEEKAARRDSGDAVMMADGQRVPGTLHYNIYSEGPARVREYMLDLDRHKLGDVKERIRFWSKRHGDVEVQAAGFEGAWKALGKCMSDFYGELGIAEADLKRMAKPPEGQLMSFLNYPRDKPLVEFSLVYWVSAEGRVDECRLLQPSGFEAFDRSLCSELKARGRFKPARDAAGKPVRVPQFDHVRIRRATS